MKNKILLIVVVIVSILLVGLILIINSDNPNTIDENIETEGVIENNTGSTTEVPSNKFTFNQAVESLVIINCDNLIDSEISRSDECKDEINYSLAMNNNSMELCKIIFETKSKIKCISNLNKQLLKNALESNDQQLCLLISDEKKNKGCISSIDTYYYDKGDCKNIYTENYKFQCFDKLDSDLFLKARSEKNTKLCNSLSKESLQKDCLKDIEYNIYIDANTLDSCYNISDTELKNKCINKVRLSTGNYDKSSKIFCEQIKDDDKKNKCFDSYYLNLIQTEKSKLQGNCNKIKNKEIKTYCLSILEKNKKAISDVKAVINLEKSGDIIGSINLSCETTRKGTDIDICKKEEITKKAINDNDIEVCNSLDTEVLQKSCNDTVVFELDSILFKKALSEKSIELCNKLSTQKKIDLCLTYIK